MGPAERPLILVSNDDGIRSAGLRALAESLASVGEVVVVAPDRERSATGHSLTLTRPLRVTAVDQGWYSVDGTPTDCVMLAVMELLPRRPQLVAAGINHGSNIGDDVTYSGTVASAIGTLETDWHQGEADYFSPATAVHRKSPFGRAAHHSCKALRASAFKPESA